MISRPNNPEFNIFKYSKYCNADFIIIASLNFSFLNLLFHSRSLNGFVKRLGFVGEIQFLDAMIKARARDV